MMEKFFHLKHREQIVLVSVFCFSLLTAFILVIWVPVNNELQRQQSRYDTAVMTMQAIETTVARIGNLQQQGNADFSLTTLVNESLQSRQLEFTRLQQLSVNQIQIRMDNVVFGDVLAWIYDIESTPGVIVNELTVRALGQSQPGLVNVTAGLSQVK